MSYNEPGSGNGAIERSGSEAIPASSANLQQRQRLINVERLTRQFILPALKLEADTVVGALEEVRTGRQAIEAVIRALIAFHVEDIDRFRLIYVVARFDTQVWQVAGLPQLADSIHATTSRMYSALEAILARAPDIAAPG